MNGFWAGTLQYVGLLVVMAGCVFRGTAKGDAIGWLLGTVGLGLYLVAAVSTGRTLYYPHSGRGRGFCDIDSPVHFCIIVFAVFGLMVLGAVECVRCLLAAYHPGFS